MCQQMRGIGLGVPQMRGIGRMHLCCEDTEKARANGIVCQRLEPANSPGREYSLRPRCSARQHTMALNHSLWSNNPSFCIREEQNGYRHFRAGRTPWQGGRQ